ncbi:histidinol dehydrogenase family protein [Aspergillus mulundensis]|uniref:Histidinol dehydrogenase n=1 Tax=Aspergillus mulundensis TaxID=1810919 RepID=A0A3D8R462_9EURO|nr:Histidinol dehydrogenase [Aspergillus mulundensis]RDW68845.1 Histidinol dehydrogenase [Aspergillus mulundensis]
MPTTFLKSKQSPAANQKPIDVSFIVSGMIDDVRENGDIAVRKYSEKFDKWSPASFKLSQAEIEVSIAQCSKQTIEDIKTVQNNVQAFAQAQKESLKDFEFEIQPGVILGQKNLPIRTVGAYIPGGRYPLLASAHMTILTAKVAGVPHVIGCTPPINGKIPHATVAAMHFAGADEIHILGGVQAIAAMAVGTDSIRKVDFIAGPGNAFVAEGKRQLFGEIGIDLFAGPTEILIVADETADPFTVATDVISQAEHGPDSPAVVITTSARVGREAIRIIDHLLNHSDLSTADVASVSWKHHGEVILVDTMQEAWKLADEYASEHVQIFTKRPRDALENMTAYGALFLGENTCVSYGDKVCLPFQPSQPSPSLPQDEMADYEVQVIGTNHVLPTRKAARYTGGLWIGKFLRTVTYQEVKDETASGELGRLCGRAARAENFEAHARSGDLRAYRHLKDEIDWIAGVKVKL